MREHKFKPFQRVLVRDRDNFAWRGDMFSHKTDDGLYWCLGCVWRQCIPYDGNEHLLGTTDSPEQPKTYFKFGDKVEVRDSIEEPWKKGIFKCRQNNKYLPFRVMTKDRNGLTEWKFCRHADW